MRCQIWSDNWSCLPCGPIRLTRATYIAAAGSFSPGGGIKPGLFGKAESINKEGPLKSSMDPPSPIWGTLKTPDPPCYVTHFSLATQLARFFLRWLTTHPNQHPKLWIPSPAVAPRAMKLGKGRGNLIPSQFTTCMAGRLLDRPRGGTELPASNAHSQNSFWETNIFQVLMSNSDFTICPLKLIIYQHENKDNLNSFYVVFWSGLHPGIM